MKFIAHRGYSKRYPENTLDAFKAVIDHPQNGRALTGIECDLQLTADNRIAVLHDITVTAGGRPTPVRELTLDELRAAYRETHAPTQATVPCAEETLALVAHRTGLCLEVKQAGYDLELFTRLLTGILEDYRPRNDIIVSSFSHEILSYLAPRTGHLGLRYGLIFSSWDAWERTGPELRGQLDYIHPKYTMLLENPDRAAAIGLPAHCWTVNSPAAVQAIVNLSPPGLVAAIMTDDIELAAQFAEA